MSSCKQGGWYKQGLKFCALLPAFLAAASLQRGPGFLAVSELCPLCLLVVLLIVHAIGGSVSRRMLWELLGVMLQLYTSKH